MLGQQVVEGCIYTSQRRMESFKMSDRQLRPIVVRRICQASGVLHWNLRPEACGWVNQSGPDNGLLGRQTVGLR